MVIQLSILIPHYNNPKLLGRVLSSIPCDQEIQTIVVDDKSTKDMAIYTDIQKQFKNVVFLKNDSSIKGAGKSRNIALDAAVGKWVLFVDSDDSLLDGWYEVIKQFFDYEGDIIYFVPTSRTEDGSVADRHVEFANYMKNYADNPNKKNELDLRYRTTAPWSKLIKRDVIEKNSIRFEEIRYAEDVMFSVPVAYYAQEIKVVLKEIYCVNSIPGSLSSQGNDISSEQTTGVLIRRYQFLKEHLSKSEFKMLDLSALGRIILSFRCRNVSFKSKCRGLKMVINAHMRILPRRLFTIGFWKNRLKK